MAAAAVDRQHPANAYFRERWARSFQVVSTDIRRLQAARLVPGETDPDTAAQCILAAWEGLQFQWLHGPEFDIKNRLESVIDAILGPQALAEELLSSGDESAVPTSAALPAGRLDPGGHSADPNPMHAGPPA